MRKKTGEVEPMFDPFSEDNLREKDWYPKFINKQERERIREQNKCTHFRWVKKCSECGLIFESEHTHKNPEIIPIISVTIERQIILKNTMV